MFGQNRKIDKYETPNAEVKTKTSLRLVNKTLCRVLKMFGTTI